MTLCSIVPIFISCSFRYADFALARVLEGPAGDVRKIINAYDVNCQWKVKAFERFSNTEPHLAKMIKHLINLIGKMHVQAHIEDCKNKLSLNFTRGVGLSDGEGGERWWAEINQAAGSTKQMNPGQRHEVLNDMGVDWNWLKTEEEGKFWYKDNMIIVTYYLTS